MKKLTKILMSVFCIMTICSSMLTFFTGCENMETIEISGSTSVQEIMTKLAGEYEKTHKVRININGNGSGAGIEDTLNNRNDFGMSSRDLKDEEQKNLDGKKLCIDGIVLAVGKNCGLMQVTNEQIYSLFMEGTPISENGITVNAGAGREESSGTREAFDEKIFDGKGENIKGKTYSGVITKNSSTGLVIDKIRNDTYNRTVGYISLGSYIKNTDTLKALKFRAYEQTEYVEASVENVRNGSYKMQRPFVIVTKKGSALSGAAKEFYDWLFGKEAGMIIEANGYIL